MLKYIPLLALAACASPELVKQETRGQQHQSQLAITMSNYIPTVEECKNGRYVDDVTVTDDWKTTDRFMQEGGDCEDFAVCYYVALESMGKSPKIILTDDHAYTVADGFRYDQTLIVGQNLHDAKWAFTKTNFYEVR